MEPQMQGNPNLAAFAQMAQQQAQQPGMQQGMPQGGAPQQGQQIPPQILAMLQARQQQGQQQPQQMPPQGGQMPPGAPQQQLSPRMQPPGAAQQGGQSAFTPQELAALGRNGDSIVAHLTPGEMTVPPQVQTPKVLATLRQAFREHHVQPQQFTAGTPQSSHNPSTGLPEYNFLSAFLPAALGIAGGVLAPEFLPALGFTGSAALGGAIGSGLGTGLGGLISGQSPLQAGLSGLGAGAGGYFLGKLGSPAADAATAGTDAAASSPQTGIAKEIADGLKTQPLSSPLLQGMSSNLGGAAGGASNVGQEFAQGLSGASGAAAPAAVAASGNAANSASLLNLYGALGKNINPFQAAGSALGATVGGAIGAPVPKTNATAALPSGFNTPMTPVSQLPSWDVALGQNTYKGPTANFNGYNAAAPNSTGFNFYPPAQGVM